MRSPLVIASIAGALCASASLAQPVQNIQFIGQQTFATGTPFAGTVLGGLSGIAYDRTNNQFFAVADDRSQINPARFYTLNINLADGTLDSGDVNFTGTTTLLRPDGTTFPALSLDPEGIALASNGDLFISSEGDVNNGQVQPFVNRFSRASGQQNLALTIPAPFAASTGNSGIRNNLAFETLTITPGGSLFTATENALKQDGPAAGVGVGSPCRILRFDASGTPASQFVYQADPVAEIPNPANAFATNGLVDMLAIDETRFLALERSFSIGAPGAGGTGNIIRLFLVDLAGATDISSRDILGDVTSYVPVQKSLLLDLSTLGIPLDNVEGLTFGPVLPNGKQSIILVSDNNFSATQFTQFIALSADVVPGPGAASLLALAGLAAARRRRD